MSFAEPRHFRHPLHDVLSSRLAAWSLELADGTPGGDLPLGDGVAQVSPCCWRVLRVGRTVQSQQFWEWLCPDEAARNTVSREQFEILGKTASADESDLHFCEFSMRNLSGRGTLLNGSVVHHEAELAVGDVISAGEVATVYGSRPVVQLRFVQRPVASTAVESYADLQFAKTMPSMLAMMVPGSEPPQAVAGGGSWQLLCVASAGRGDEDIRCSAVALPLLLVGDGACQAVSVGRAMQPMSFWEDLVRDQALRNAISRDHFEVRLDGGGAFRLESRGAAGTLLNGALVRGSCSLRPGDIVALPGPLESSRGDPIAQFRLVGLDPAGSAAPPPLPRAPVVAASAVPAAASPPAPPPPPPVAQASAASPCEGLGPSAPPPPPPPPPAVAGAACQAAPREAPQDTAAAAGPARGEAVPMVKISVAVLPPPFTLVCVAARRLTDSDLACVRHESRTLEASCADARIRVGLEEQPDAFWEALLPDAGARASLPRSFFELCFGDAEDGGVELLLWNRSPAGTLLNGKLVLDHAGLLHGDLIGVCASPADSTPLVTFRLSIAGAEG